MVALIEHHTIADGTSEDHFHNYDQNNPRHNCLLVANEDDIINYIITHFSPEGGTILDVTGQKGKLEVPIIIIHKLHVSF